MDGYFWDFTDALASAASMEDVQAVAAKQMSRLGIHTLTWVSAPFSPSVRRYFSTFDHAMVEARFRNIDSNPGDSLIWRAAHGPELRPMAWGRSVRPLQPPSRGVQEFGEQVAAYGCLANVNIPVWHPKPREYEFLTVSLAMTEKEFDGYIRHHAPLLVSSAALISAQMAVLTPAREEDATRLTARESECLSWLAAGLRHERVAERLSISEWTVMFHLKNAREKLAAATNEQAVAKAVLHGLIVP